MLPLVNRREQGDFGELSAATWFVEQGALIALPFGHSPDWDLIAEFPNRMVRIQVKTTGCFRNGRWEVAICTRGGNQSWNGVVKRFSSDRCDYLFVHVADGRRWLIPSEDVDAGTGVVLGGPKYERYEVDRGRPFAATTAG
jgi:hypothetical protein